MGAISMQIFWIFTGTMRCRKVDLVAMLFEIEIVSWESKAKKIDSSDDWVNCKCGSSWNWAYSWCGVIIVNRKIQTGFRGGSLNIIFAIIVWGSYLSSGWGEAMRRLPRKGERMKKVVKHLCGFNNFGRIRFVWKGDEWKDNMPEMWKGKQWILFEKKSFIP